MGSNLGEIKFSGTLQGVQVKVAEHSICAHSALKVEDTSQRVLKD